MLVQIALSKDGSNRTTHNYRKKSILPKYSSACNAPYSLHERRWGRRGVVIGRCMGLMIYLGLIDWSRLIHRITTPKLRIITPNLLNIHIKNTEWTSVISAVGGGGRPLPLEPTLFLPENKGLLRGSYLIHVNPSCWNGTCQIYVCWKSNFIYLYYVQLHFLDSIRKWFSREK